MPSGASDFGRRRSRGHLRVDIEGRDRTVATSRDFDRATGTIEAQISRNSRINYLQCAWHVPCTRWTTMAHSVFAVSQPGIVVADAPILGEVPYAAMADSGPVVGRSAGFGRLVGGGASQARASVNSFETAHGQSVAKGTCRLAGHGWLCAGPNTLSVVERGLSNPRWPRLLRSEANRGWAWLGGVEGDCPPVSSGRRNQSIDVSRLSGQAAPGRARFIRTRGWGLSSLSRQGNRSFLSSGDWGTEGAELDL
jgi:hypothetical protein